MVVVVENVTPKVLAVVVVLDLIMAKLYVVVKVKIVPVEVELVELEVIVLLDVISKLAEI